MVFASGDGRAARDRGGRPRRVRLLGRCRWGRRRRSRVQGRADVHRRHPRAGGEARSRRSCSPPATARRRSTTCRRAACRRRRTWSARDNFAVETWSTLGQSAGAGGHRPGGGRRAAGGLPRAGAADADALPGRRRARAAAARSDPRRRRARAHRLRSVARRLRRQAGRGHRGRSHQPAAVLQRRDVLRQPVREPSDHRGARGRRLPGDLLAGAQRRHARRRTATPASR